MTEISVDTKVERQINIALIGVFDLANYGDHLFPLVLKQYLAKKHVDCRVDLFSIYEQPEAFVTGVQVYSIFDLEKKHLQKKYDLLFVGGGDIVHYGAYKHANSGKQVIYPIFALWTIPSLIAKKHNIKIAWNSPGIPFDFCEPFMEFTKEVISVVDYISVRNISSKEALNKLEIPSKKECFVFPDTAFALRDCFDEKTQIKICQFKQGRAVFARPCL